jgi:hypothetical protein
VQVWPLAHTANAAPAPQGHAFVDVSAVEDPTSLGRDSRCGPSDHHYHWSDRMAQQRLRFHPKAKRLRCAAPHSPPRNTGTHRPPATGSARGTAPARHVSPSPVPTFKCHVPLATHPPPLTSNSASDSPPHHQTVSVAPPESPSIRELPEAPEARAPQPPPDPAGLRCAPVSSIRGAGVASISFSFPVRFVVPAREGAEVHVRTNPLPFSIFFFPGHIRSRGAL